MIDVTKIPLPIDKHLVNLAKEIAILIPQSVDEFVELLKIFAQGLFTSITSCLTALIFACSKSIVLNLLIVVSCWLIVFPFIFVVKGKDGKMLVLYRSYKDLLKDRRQNAKGIKEPMSFYQLYILFPLLIYFYYLSSTFISKLLPTQFRAKISIAMLILFGFVYLLKKAFFLKIPGRIIVKIWNGALEKQWDTKRISIVIPASPLSKRHYIPLFHHMYHVYTWHDLPNDKYKKEEFSPEQVKLILQILRHKGLQLEDLKVMKSSNANKLFTKSERNYAKDKADHETGENGLIAQPTVAVLKPSLKDKKVKASFFKTEPLDLKLNYDDAEIIKRNVVSFFDEFNVNCKVEKISASPSFYLVHLQPEKGTRLDSLYKVKDDISYYLDASVFFEVFDRKLFLGARRKDQVLIEAGHVYFNSKLHKPLDVMLGLTLQGKTYSFNLSEAPHMLIAGTTGSGKSVLIHSVINSMFITTPANILRFMLIDPKQIEFGVYDKLPHLISPVITDTDKVVDHLSWLVDEMNERYTILKTSRCRNVEEYNEKGGEKIPYIVLVVDELGDIMMREDSKKVEKMLVTLAQKARAAGIHMILATQRPSAAVFTGLLKANIPCRVSCRVSSSMESRIIMDRPGAESLIGNGDTLFWSSGMKDPIRLHCPYIKTASIESCVAFQNRNYRGARHEQR